MGGLPIEMSFLGDIGNVMAGSGLKELFEVIYAEGAVPHMHSGKAIARAIRAHLLIDAVLRSKLISISLKDETGLASQVKTKSKKKKYAQTDIDNQGDKTLGQRMEGNEDNGDRETDHIETKNVMKRN